MTNPAVVVAKSPSYSITVDTKKIDEIPAVSVFKGPTYTDIVQAKNSGQDSDSNIQDAGMVERVGAMFALAARGLIAPLKYAFLAAGSVASGLMDMMGGMAGVVFVLLLVGQPSIALGILLVPAAVGFAAGCITAAMSIVEAPLQLFRRRPEYRPLLDRVFDPSF